MRKIYLLFIIALLALVACNDDNDQDDLFDTYQLKSYTIGDGSFAPQDTITMTLHEELDANLTLNVNHCFSSYSLPGHKNIRFKGFACTEACCDSDIAKRFVQLLPDVRYYKLHGDKLTLFIPHEGFIHLKRLE